MRMRQVGNDALCRGQEWGSLSWIQYEVGLWAKWVHQSQWVGMRVSWGVQDGSNFDECRDQNWAAKVSWVKGPRAKEMHLGWVEGPQAEEMRAGWVQASQDQ